MSSTPLNPSDPVNFDFQSAQLIANVVRRANQTTPALQHQIRQPVKSNDKPPFLARITGRDGQFYSWHMLNVVQGKVQDADTHDDDYSARELQDRVAAEGDRVSMQWAGYDEDGNAAYQFSIGQERFWAKVTCYCPLSTGIWKYSWVEQERTPSGWITKPSGRSGDCCKDSGYALNSIEAFNGENDRFGNGQLTDGGQYILPVSGEPVVEMFAEFPPLSFAESSSSSSGNTETVVYSFAYENGEADEMAPDVDCGCSHSGTSSETTQTPSSDAFFCIFAFSCTYDCDAGTWGTVQRSGVNCMIPPANLNTWLKGPVSDPSQPVYYYYVQGPPCGGPEQTHACGTWPTTPSTPTISPNCGSSSETTVSSSATDFVCVYSWTSTFDCNAGTWGPVQRNGGACQPPPATTGAWMGSHTVGYYYTIGGPCPGIEQDATCTAWLSAPGTTPGWTPVCGSSSSQSGESSQSNSSGGSTHSESSSNPCPDFYTGDVTVVTDFDASTCTITQKVMHFKCGKLTGVS